MESDHIIYRPFRNSDLEEIVKIWNETTEIAGLRQGIDWALFHQTVLSKPYFSREYFLVAVDTSAERVFPHDGKIIGFIHGGFSPNKTMDGLDTTHGCIAMLIVEKNENEEFRKAVTAKLLTLLEEVYRKNGAEVLTAGAVYPDAPFYFGMYVGGESYGIHEKNSFANSLLKKNGYVLYKRYDILKVNLQNYYSPYTRQRRAIQSNFDMRSVFYPMPATWWEAVARCTLECRRYELYPKNEDTRCANVLVERMIIPVEEQKNKENDGNTASVKTERRYAGIHHLEVEPDFRRQGLGKYLVKAILEIFQKKDVKSVEFLIPEDDPAARRIFFDLNPTSINSGLVYRKKLVERN